MVVPCCCAIQRPCSCRMPCTRQSGIHRTAVGVLPVRKLYLSLACSTTYDCKTVCILYYCPQTSRMPWCRHYAYCVPYTPRSSLSLNSITTVVVSERINETPEAVAKGILAHELGHSIDFHCFGSRCAAVPSCLQQKLASEETVA